MQIGRLVLWLAPAAVVLAGCSSAGRAVPAEPAATVVAVATAGPDPALVADAARAATWVQVGEDIDGESAFDQSGWSVSISSDGRRAAIGAPFNGADSSSSGNVRVFDWDGTGWAQVGADIDVEPGGDFWGGSVVLSDNGSRLAVGGPLGNSSGEVRVFDWDGANWVQLGEMINGEASDSQAGGSLALSGSGSRLVVGASAHDGNAGQVRVFDWDGDRWAQVGASIGPEADVGGSVGEAVAVSSDGSRLAVGAPRGSGRVRVFDWDGADWAEVGAPIDGEAAGDRSGESVALSSDGSRVAIGAPGNGGNGELAGHVRVFDWDGAVWVQVGADIDSEAEYDRAGSAVSLSADGSRVAYGAPRNDGTSGTWSGHVRVFDWDGTAWVQVGADLDGEADQDESGKSVALSADGSRIAIGAQKNDGSGGRSGHVRVFTTGDPTRPAITSGS